MSVRKEVNKYVSMQIIIYSMPFSIGLTGSSSGHDMDAGLVPEDSADMVLTVESEGVAANRRAAARAPRVAPSSALHMVVANGVSSKTSAGSLVRSLPKA